MGNKVFVVGVGMTKFEKPGSKEWDYPDMAEEAGKKALADAGIAYSEIQQAVAGYCYGDSTCGERAVYTLGLTGIFINRQGREAQGTVASGPECDALCAEIKAKLEKLLDPKTAEPVVKEAFLTRQIHSGPYADMAPEILVGYHRGFRHSWDCATGAVSREIFTDNTKSWSGDHCVDPRLVPGVFWCNRKIPVDDPNLLDIAPSALDLFGVEVPSYMQGRRLFEAAGVPPRDRETGPVRNLVASR